LVTLLIEEGNGLALILKVASLLVEVNHRFLLALKHDYFVLKLLAPEEEALIGHLIFLVASKIVNMTVHVCEIVLKFYSLIHFLVHLVLSGSEVPIGLVSLDLSFLEVLRELLLTDLTLFEVLSKLLLGLFNHCHLGLGSFKLCRMLLLLQLFLQAVHLLLLRGT
jgi:hypothetical protein